MKKISSLFLLFFILSNVWAQSDLLQSGPMVGYTKAGATRLWVQTKKEALVKIKYYEVASEKNYFFTNEYSTSKNEAYTALLTADKTIPGKNYQYELYINNTLVPRPYPLFFKTNTENKNEPINFKVALGSCAFVNDTLRDDKENHKGGGYEIYKAIADQKPDMMLWLGDNVYFRKNDWNSKEGMMYRYTHTRSLYQMQPLLGNTENIAAWDDHDYGPNDSDKEFKNKKLSLEVFKLFWPNPPDAFNSNESIATTFVRGDVQFFLLDDRTYRSPADTDSDDKKELLGEKQILWLMKELRSSTAVFKIIVMGGQVLNPLEVYETYANYEKEWKSLLSQLEKEKIPGLVFFSGDRHFSEVMKMTRKNNYPLYEFTVSPLNSRPYMEGSEKNPIRIQGSLIQQYNFATLDFSGQDKDRVMKVQYRNKDGVMLFEKVIKAEELK
jgi:alkaline phosphatase D